MFNVFNKKGILLKISQEPSSLKYFLGPANNFTVQ